MDPCRARRDRALLGKRACSLRRSGSRHPGVPQRVCGAGLRDTGDDAAFRLWARGIGQREHPRRHRVLGRFRRVRNAFIVAPASSGRVVRGRPTGGLTRLRRGVGRWRSYGSTRVAGTGKRFRPRSQKPARRLGDLARGRVVPLETWRGGLQRFAPATAPRGNVRRRDVAGSGAAIDATGSVGNHALPSHDGHLDPGGQWLRFSRHPVSRRRSDACRGSGFSGCGSIGHALRLGVSR